MAKKLRPGNRVRDYEIIELLNVGAMAISYSAMSGSGDKVFLKQYKSPSVRVPWYHGYVGYQEELKKRVQAGTLSHMTVEIVDMFEAPAGPLTYFQVFEFVQGGEDLSGILDKMHDRPGEISWPQRVVFAKVIMGSIKALHGANIIHSDLKPKNLQLFKDDEIKAGYRLKLIDMDFSVLSDVEAPWHGSDTGYVGTPGYMSPEHLNGDVPLKASDVFTCGLILYELLSTTGHPYPYEPDEYRRATSSHKAVPPTLAGTIDSPASNEDIAAVLHKCLSPSPDDRPTATDVLSVLNGIGKPRVQGRLVLVSDSGATLDIGIRTDVGTHILRKMGDDSRFVDKKQFTLEKRSDGWTIIPNTSAKNETILNGKAITEDTVLASDDVIGIGRESKGIVKLPMKVQIGD